MIAIIDKVDSGKTRRLLRMCSLTDGLFICAHPERVLDKCNAYEIKSVRSSSFSQVVDLIEKEDKFYIDDVDKLINFLKDTYSKEQAFIYLSLISSKVEGFTLSCDGDQIMTLMYHILEN